HLSVQPALVVWTSTRRQRRDDRYDRLADLLVEGVVFRLGAAHDVPGDVAAYAERRQQNFIDPRDGLLEVALEHAVELEVLARRHPQRSVGPLLTDVVVGDVCIRGHD